LLQFAVVVAPQEVTGVFSFRRNVEVLDEIDTVGADEYESMVLALLALHEVGGAAVLFLRKFVVLRDEVNGVVAAGGGEALAVFAEFSVVKKDFLLAVEPLGVEPVDRGFEAWPARVLSR